MRSPLSTWRVMRASTSHSQQKFSMNWLGSSTASHSTPLMPDTPSSSTCVSRWCRPWPNSWNSVITSSCVNSAGLLAHGRGEVAVEVGHRRLHAPADAPAVDRVVHPGAAALGLARIQVEVELADALARRVGDLVEAHRRVPDLGAAPAGSSRRTAFPPAGTCRPAPRPRGNTASLPGRRTRSAAGAASRSRRRRPRRADLGQVQLRRAKSRSSCMSLSANGRARRARSRGSRAPRAGIRAILRGQRHLGVVGVARAAARFLRAQLQDAAIIAGVVPLGLAEFARRASCRRGTCVRAGRGCRRTASPACRRACAA